MRIESLEPRRLLSVTVVKGVLTVTGTAQADTIALTGNAKSIQVNDDGLVSSFVPKGVTNILISAAGGDDSVMIADTILIPAAITGDKGNDVLHGGGGKDFLSGGSGNDSLSGGGGNDSINGDDGDDTVEGDAGADTMLGGPGNDTATYVTRTAPLHITVDDVADDGEKGEMDNVGGGIETIIGGSGDDFIVGSKLNNSLDGKLGNDTLMGGSGVDALIGEDGNDLLVGGPDGDFIDGGKNNDTIQGQAGADTINPGSGNDQIDGGADLDTLDYSSRIAPLSVKCTASASSPAAIIAGQKGETDAAVGVESVLLGAANDTFSANQTALKTDLAPAQFSIDGGAGDDSITINNSAPGVQFIAHGGSGNDLLTYIPHSLAKDVDSLYGDDGDDVFREGAGSAKGNLSLSFFGGPGVDTVDMTALSSSKMSLDDVANDGYGSDNIHSDVENLYGSSLGSSLVIGNDSDNFIAVGMGGKASGNTVLGEGGDDTLVGGAASSDSLDGGDGNDIFANADGVPDTVNGGAGFDIAESDGVDSFLSVTSLYGLPSFKPAPILKGLSVHAALATQAPASIDARHVLDISGALDVGGKPLADSISVVQRAGVFTVTINGVVSTFNITKLGIKGIFIDSGGGNDVIALQSHTGTQAVTVPATITSGAGDDQVTGGTGADSIVAGDGNDTVDGGAGDDTINGAAGSDVLFGSAGNDSLFGADGNDLLYGGNDTMLSGDGADTLSGGAGFGDGVNYAARIDNLLIDLSDGTNATDGATGEHDSVLTDVENIFSGRGSDSLIGNASANYIAGGAGSDTISAGDGMDKLIGEADQDTVNGQGGAFDYFSLHDGTADHFDGTPGEPCQPDVGLDVNSISGHVV